MKRRRKRRQKRFSFFGELGKAPKAGGLPSLSMGSIIEAAKSAACGAIESVYLRDSYDSGVRTLHVGVRIQGQEIEVIRELDVSPDKVCSIDHSADLKHAIFGER